MPLTIFDVAKRAGVSKSTVSRVFNNGYGVAPEVAESVRKAAAALGYNSYKMNARGRPKRDTGGIRAGSVAVLIPDTGEAVMRTVLSGRLAQGVNSVLSRNRLSMIFTNLSSGGEMPVCIEKKQVDGIIIRAGLGLNALLSKVGGLPSVITFECPDFSNVINADFVQPDNRMVAEFAISHLKECRNIAVISNEPLHNAVIERACEFMSLSEKLGIKASRFVEDSTVAEMIKKIFKGKNRPDGIFIPVGDMAVVEACTALRQMGLKPVDDVKIIACCNDPGYMWTSDNRIPNIDIRPDAIGQAAAEILLQRIKNPSGEYRRILVRPRLQSPVTSFQ